MSAYLSHGLRVAIAFGLLATVAVAQPTITVDDDFGLPDEAFFAANPGTTVNVKNEGVISVGSVTDPFDFNGAIVNVENRGEVGSFSASSRAYLDNLTLNLVGGLLWDETHFSGLTGTTNVNIMSGNARNQIQVLGNAQMNISGGTVGVNPGTGIPSIVVGGSSLVTQSEGHIDRNLLVNETGSFVMTGGTMENFFSVTDNGTMTIAGGATAEHLDLFENATLNITSGTVGRFLEVWDSSVVNLSGGGIGTGAIVRDGTVNLRGGAVASGFQAYGGKVNVMGGVIGSGFSIGNPNIPANPQGDVEIFAKSATIDGMMINTRIITEREGQFLSAELVLGGTIGLGLDSTDPIEANSLLRVTIITPGDANGDNVADAIDYTIWRDNLGGVVPLFTLGDFDGSGTVTAADYGVWAANYDGLLPGLGSGHATATSVPEPMTATMLAVAATLLPLRRRSV